MRETIDRLLALPETERQQMEQAVAYTWTMDEPAPCRSPQPELPGAAAVRIVASVNMDTVEAVEMLCAHQLRPAALNFAHEHNCGGGFDHAHGSQEEDCFRKTSCFLSLWPHRRSDDGAGVLRRGQWIGKYDHALRRKESFYPHAECGGVYSPHVRVLRSSQRRGARQPGSLWPVEEIADAPLFGMLTIAAQNVPRSPPFQRDLLREKVRCVYRMAFENGHDSLVLGAFGCGYFGNPAGLVAQTFRDVLAKEFAGAFDVVVFAVLGNRRDSNVKAFATEFPMHTYLDMQPLLQALATWKSSLAPEDLAVRGLTADTATLARAVAAAAAAVAGAGDDLAPVSVSSQGDDGSADAAGPSAGEAGQSKVKAKRWSKNDKSSKP